MDFQFMGLSYHKAKQNTISRASELGFHSTLPNLEDWEAEQLLKLRERQPDRIEPALRRLVQENDEIRWSVAIGAYQDRQINLGKAAELLCVTELELRGRFIELGIPLRIGPADLAEARAEVEAMRAWFDHTPDEDHS